MRKIQPWFVASLVGLVAQVFLGLLLAGISYWIGQTLAKIEADEFAPDSALDLLETLEASSGLIWAGLGVFALVGTVGLMGFLFQVARATAGDAEQMAEDLPKGKFRFSPGWGIGGWFIPIVAIFVIPLFIADQLDGLRVKRRGLLKFLVWFYLPVTLVASRGLVSTASLYGEAESLGDFVFVFYTDSILAFGYVLTAVLMMAVILTLKSGLRSWLEEKPINPALNREETS
jgi:hypothetical protein